jgi:hypothetical protein
MILAGHALSRKRICIVYGQGISKHCMVSPPRKLFLGTNN